MTRPIRRVAIYCGSASPENPRYEELAMEIGDALARQLDVARIGRRGGAAVDGQGIHLARSSSIRPAVAFALPTTPGIPAPGWVPAPTR